MYLPRQRGNALESPFFDFQCIVRAPTQCRSNVPTSLIFERAAMTITTLSSREFNQGASEAKRAANNGPICITDRGRPAHVLMSIELYQRITGSQKKIADLLAMPGIADVDFEVARAKDPARSADFS